MSTIKQSLSRYTSDWSARIEFLKKSLDTESKLREHASHPQAPAETAVVAPTSAASEIAAGLESSQLEALLSSMKRLEQNMESLSDRVKQVQETSGHEVRKMIRKFEELEQFVKMKEIDLQNLKSDSVEHRLVHEDLKKKIEEQAKKSIQTKEELGKNAQDLTQVIIALKSQILEMKSARKSERPGEPTLQERRQERRQEQAAVSRPISSSVPNAVPAAASTSASARVPEFIIPGSMQQAANLALHEEKSFLERLIDWWNEPVTKISLRNKESD